MSENWDSMLYITVNTNYKNIQKQNLTFACETVVIKNLYKLNKMFNTF